VPGCGQAPVAVSRCGARGSICRVGTSERYARFARVEARGESSLYQSWADGVAADVEVLALIDALPQGKRQPNLVFAAARFAGGPEASYGQFRTWLLSEWAAVAQIILTHNTQTNEARRCAVLLPLLAALPQPLALLEVGAAAGLCLYPDMWSYQYDQGAVIEPRAGSSASLLTCATTGSPPIPVEAVDVVWRAGIDLNPLNVQSGHDVDWLRCLVWPGQAERRDVLEAAIGLARADPPQLVEGDLCDELPALARQAPDNATLVIFHSAVLAYLEKADRDRFRRIVEDLPAQWIANEAPSVFGIDGPRPSTDGRHDAARFLLSLNGQPRAYTGPHGQSLDWIA
jgi:hypothetical protein